MAYDQTITASGGTGNITLTVNNIQNAIAGLVLPSSGSNSLTIGGKPTAAGTESFTIMATDALGATTSTTYSITVTNNPPALAGIEGTALDYTEGNPATAVTSSLAVSDAESATLAGATIWISGNYQSGEDVLSFVNTGNIAGNWDAATGTLTLSGSDTLANYQAALQAVTYVNNCLDPSTATRTVSFRVNDGQADSNVLSRDIAVQLLDPAVDDVVLGGPTASSVVNDYPADTVFCQITFNGNCALSGNAVLLDSTIVNAQGNNALSLPLVFGDDAIFQVTQGSLAVEGPIDTAGHLLTVDTAGGTTASFTAPITGSGGLSKSGGGTLVLSGGGGSLDNVAVQSGVLQVTTADGLADGGVVDGRRQYRAVFERHCRAVTARGCRGGCAGGCRWFGQCLRMPAAVQKPERGAGVPPASSAAAGTAAPQVVGDRILSGIPPAAHAKVIESLAANLARRSAGRADWPWGAIGLQGNGQAEDRDTAILARDAVLAEYAR